MELSREIVRQGKKDLRIASLQTLISTDLLIGAKAVKSVRFAMNQFELFGFVSNFTRAAESNEIEVIEDT
jgi:acyl CoA:acetate/3-ketoacid CoA transferase alpha subunit